MKDGSRIIVTGYLAQYPLGGVTWDYFQYVLGLARMGHDVYYIEDTGQWPYWPESNGLVKDCHKNVQFLSELMDSYGLGERWAYRFPWKSQWFGLPDAVRQEIVATADLVINVSGTLEKPEEYRGRAQLAYIDSDPVFTQVKLANGQAHFRKLVSAHDVQFSFGESMSEQTPNSGDDWLPTRQPIVLAEWQPSREYRKVFTTVMNWNAYKPMTYAGRTFGQKDVEFEKFKNLPRQVDPVQLEVAANSGKGHHLPEDELRNKGWGVVDPTSVCATPKQYRDYIQASMAEWSIAKNGYVVGQAGWFSCRSACYLAAGRPVVVQDTGFSRVLPCGEGLLAFNTPKEAALGIRDVVNRYPVHAEAARALAESHFDASKVLSSLIERALNPGVAHDVSQA